MAVHPQHLGALCTLLMLLITPTAPGQGNGRDAGLEGRFMGLPPVSVTARHLSAGQSIRIDIESPGASLVGQPFWLAGEIRRPSSVPYFQLPGEPGVLAVSPALVWLVGGAVAPPLPMGGVQVPMITPAGLEGTMLNFQAAVLDATAPNGLAVTPLSQATVDLPPSISSLVGNNTLQGAFGYGLDLHDVDGDGVPEILVGARFEDTAGGPDRGKVYIFKTGQTTPWRELYDPTPEAGSLFGGSVTVGDINGDQAPDIIVGAREATHQGIADAGKAVIFYGPNFTNTTRLHSTAPINRGLFGHRMVCGDFDGDGNQDLAVAEIGATGSGGQAQTGALTLFYGPLLTVTRRIDCPVPAPAERFGYRLEAGDVDQDGIDDLAVAAPFKPLLPGNSDASGALYLLRGPQFGTLAYFPNPAPSSQGLLGADMVLRDLDGDGNLDLLAGAELDDSGGLAYQGSIYVLPGPAFNVAQPTQIFSHAPVASGGFGSGLDVGDFDGDGLNDLLVGEFRYTGSIQRQGAASILFGPDYLNGTRVLEPTAASSNEFGRRVRAADLDGDGRAEMVVGVPQSSLAGRLRSGAVYIIQTP